MSRAAESSEADNRLVADLQARAANGDSAAMYELAEALTRGEHVTRNIGQALDYYRQAAQSWYLPAQLRLGRMLYHGEGVTKDREEAAVWLRKAAVQGNREVYVMLAQAVLSTPDGTEESMYWNYKALPASAPYLGSLYLSHKNSQAAVLFFEMSAKENSFAAQKLESLRNDGITPERALEHFRSRRIVPEDILRGDLFLPLADLAPPLPMPSVAAPYTVLKEERALEEWTKVHSSNAAHQADAEAQVQASHATAHSFGANSGTVKTNIAQSATTNGSTNEHLFSSQLYTSPVGFTLAGKYLIEAIIGRGGMATVFRAMQLLIDRPVAIKLMLPEVAGEEDSMERFLREAKAASSLKHPNIVTVFDYGNTPEGLPYMVMDYLQGQSLSELLDSVGKLPPQRAINILAQVCDALIVAHHSHIVHRDIKPSNVMLEDTLTQKDFVRLVDFGLAKSLDGKNKLTKSGEVFGSLQYMSPEQCKGESLDGRADIYAFGCMLYEILTGDIPFNGASAWELMSKHVSAEPPDLRAQLKAYPQAEALDRIFHRAVEKFPDNRFQSVAEMKAELLALV